MNPTHYDIALVAVVSIMGTATAYLRNPERKAFVLMLPVPFTLATLAVNKPVDATNVLAMVLLFGFAIGVWALHARLRWPILPAIIVCAGAYCLGGIGLSRRLPSGGAAFWSSAVLVFGTALALVRLLPHREEPHHRTPLPVWVKLPAILMVTALLVAMKHPLGGFMTMFPMVSLVAAYEARHSLWTIVRRIPWIMLLMTPMMVVIRLVQPRIGLPAALAVAWPVLLMLLWGLRRRYGTGPLSRDRAVTPS